MRAKEMHVVEADAWQGGVLVRFEDGESAYFQGYLLHAARGLAEVLQMREEERVENKLAVTD